MKLVIAAVIALAAAFTIGADIGEQLGLRQGR